MARTKHWLMIAGAGSIAAACTLSFDDSEVKPRDDASSGGTISTGGTATGGVAGQDASSGGAPTGGGGAPTGGGGSPDGAAGAPSGGGGTTSGGGGTPSGGGGTTSGGGGTTSGGGGTTSGGGGTGPVGPPPCAIGSDDFADGVLAAIWSPWGPVAPIESGGRLEIKPLGTNPVHSGVATKLKADMRDCAVWIEASQVLSSSFQTSVYLYVYSSADVDGAYLQWEEGLLRVGTKGNTQVLPYSAAADRWWRINSSAGTTKLETSPDAQTWAVKHSIKTFASWVLGYAELGAGTWQAQQENIGVALFDNFNK